MSLSANSVTLGCDCRGEIFYFDRTLNIMDDQPLAEPAKGGLGHRVSRLRW
jgi:hypothetical protein